MFDQIVREAAERYGLGDKAGPLVQNVVTMMTDENAGGMMAFLKGFGDRGMVPAVSSWISKGDNEPLSASQVEAGLGSGAVSEIAGKLGLDPGVVGNAMSFVIPRIVDQLTPDGGIPTSSALQSRLGGLVGAAPDDPAALGKAIRDEAGGGESQDGGLGSAIGKLLGGRG